MSDESNSHLVTKSLSRNIRRTRLVGHISTIVFFGSLSIVSSTIRHWIDHPWSGVFKVLAQLIIIASVVLACSCYYVADRGIEISVRSMKRGLGTKYVRLKHTARRLFPSTSWREILPSKKHSRSEPSFLKTAVLIVGFALLIAFAALIASLIIMSRSRELEFRTVQLALSYNILYIAAIMTLAMIVLWLVIIVVNSWKWFEIQIPLRQVPSTIAAYIGYFSAFGAVVAALTPLMDIVVPSGSLLSLPPLSPVVLLEIPAYFAVFGYFIGLIRVVFTLGGGFVNLLYQSAIFPILFTTSSVFFIRVFNLSPASLMSETLAQSQLGVNQACPGTEVEYYEFPSAILGISSEDLIRLPTSELDNLAESVDPMLVLAYWDKCAPESFMLNSDILSNSMMIACGVLVLSSLLYRALQAYKLTSRTFYEDGVEDVDG